MEKLIARLNAGEQEGGNEIVAAVIVLGFVVGCGVALMGIQGNITNAISTAGDTISSTFNSMVPSGKEGAVTGNETNGGE
jgi:hypothetical protein